MWNLHFYPTLLLFVTRTSARCWQPGKNPYWLAAPVVEQVTKQSKKYFVCTKNILHAQKIFRLHKKYLQVSLTSVRVSWAGLLENAECADTIKVKFWPLSAPSGYTVLPRRGLGADTTAFTVTGLSQYQRYAFQVPPHCRQFLITVSTNVPPLPAAAR